MQRLRAASPAVGLLLVLALAVAPSASGQTSLGPLRVEGYLGVGGWLTAGDDEEGKFLEYRDLDDGGVVGEYRLLLEDEDGRYFLRSSGVNLGYEDQRYELEMGRYGRFRLDAFFRELPHVFSTDARSLYLRTGGESYTLPGTVQADIAGAADPSAQLAAELLNAGDADLEFRWLEAGGGLDLQVSEGIRLYGNYRLQNKNGTRAQAIDWGSPGGSFVAFPLKVDEKIHEVKAGGELLLGDASVSLEYLGSFFENDLREAVVDNPLVAVDADDAARRGRLGLSPDNAAHSLALSGAARLPTGFPARAVASFVYGVRLQDQTFLDHTINPAIAPTVPGGLDLPQTNLDGHVETWLVNVVLDADPLPGLDLGLRYRLYRYDNRSDELLFPEHVRNDDEIEDSPRTSVANDYTVHKLTTDASYAISNRVTGHAGYAWEYWNRSSDRQVDDLHEHGPTVKLDYRHSAQTSLGASYAFRFRDGDSYDTFAFFDEVFDAAGQMEARRSGEFDELVKYDQGDRDLHRVDVQARSLCGESLELSFSGGLNYADYRNTDFGLTDELAWNVGGEAWYQAHPRVGIGLFYDFEAIEYEQESRWRPRLFFGNTTALDDPLNDWSSDTRSRFHTTGANAEVALVPERVDLQLGYEFHYGRERTTSSGAPGSARLMGPTTSGDGGNAVNFPEIEETLQALTAGFKFRLTENVSLLTQYRFEAFDLDDDFRRQGLGPFLAGSNVDGDGTVSDSTDIFLANDVEDYQVHLFRVIARLQF